MIHIDHIYAAIENQLQSLGYSYQKPKELANCILSTSEFYIQRSGVSPWSNPQFCAAYLAHFLPMNILRIQKGLERLKEMNLPDLYLNRRMIDYGSGPLSFLFAYLLAYKSWPVNYSFFDSSDQGPNLGLKILKDIFSPQQIPQSLSPLAHPDDIQSEDLVCLSYALNELPQDQKTKLLDHSYLLIFEPSMRTTSRELLEFRKSAIEAGHLALAPCTHSLACPMLELSQKDWCFDRTPLVMPEICENLYKILPFDSKQATFSYLFLTKNKADDSQVSDPKRLISRIVGDNQKEKGKTRTMICRSDQREFLSILKKQRLDLELNRGDRLTLPEAIEIKGNEIRLTDLA